MARRPDPITFERAKERLAAMVPTFRMARTFVILFEDLCNDLGVALPGRSKSFFTGDEFLPMRPRRGERVIRTTGELTSKRTIQLPTTNLVVAPSAHTTPLPTTTSSTGGDELTKMERTLLVTVRQYGTKPLTAAKIATYAGYSRRNGDLPKALARLRREGYLDGFRLTPEGDAILGKADPLPRGEALRAYWEERLDTTMQRRIFRIVCQAYPNGISLDDARDAAGYSPTNGDVPKAVAKLRALDLISPRQPLRASDHLFEK